MIEINKSKEYEIEKQNVGRHLISFINKDNLISLASAIDSGLKILKINDAIELVEKINNNVEIKLK